MSQEKANKPKKQIITSDLTDEDMKVLAKFILILGNVQRREELKNKKRGSK